MSGTGKPGRPKGAKDRLNGKRVIAPSVKLRADETMPLPNEKLDSKTPTKFTPAKRKKVLEMIAAGSPIALAAQKVGVSPATVYHHRKKDEGFNQEVQDARDIATARLEESAYNRATYGVKKPVFHRGEEVGHITEYSDTLAIRFLEARAEGFDRKSKLEVSGPGGNPIQMQAAQIIAQIQADPSLMEEMDKFNEIVVDGCQNEITREDEETGRADVERGLALGLKAVTGDEGEDEGDDE